MNQFSRFECTLPARLMFVAMVAVVMSQALDWVARPRLERLNYELRVGPAVEVISWKAVGQTIERGAPFVVVEFVGRRHRLAASTINGFWYIDKAPEPWVRSPPMAGGYSIADGEPHTYMLTVPTPNDASVRWPAVGERICYDDITTFPKDPQPPIRTPRLCWTIVEPADGI